MTVVITVVAATAARLARKRDNMADVEESIARVHYISQNCSQTDRGGTRTIKLHSVSNNMISNYRHNYIQIEYYIQLHAITPETQLYILKQPQSWCRI